MISLSICHRNFIYTFECSKKTEVNIYQLSRVRPRVAAGDRRSAYTHLWTRAWQSPSFLIQGGFGKCYEVHSRESDRRYACKVIDKTSPQYALTKGKVQSEVGIHRRMEHPNIVRF
jgi:serine/threonine protein kinase